ncbi:ATP-binding protein [Streptomyces parvus]|uniref:ATP-binding protein n=1 Tax=Streptomyces parvus TaxID=66428 RepID=UPI003402A1BF
MSTSSSLVRAAYRFVVPNSALAPKVGRDLLATLLVITGHPQFVDAARLCVSEVITNVHLHTRTTLLYLDVHTQAGRVNVSVWDEAWRQRPTPARPGDYTDDERGRGLLLVQSLASQWGVTWPAEAEVARKRVWFVLDESEQYGAAA